MYLSAKSYLNPASSEYVPPATVDGFTQQYATYTAADRITFLEAFVQKQDAQIKDLRNILTNSSTQMQTITSSLLADQLLLRSQMAEIRKTLKNLGPRLDSSAASTQVDNTLPSKQSSPEESQSLEKAPNQSTKTASASSVYTPAHKFSPSSLVFVPAARQEPPIGQRICVKSWQEGAELLKKAFELLCQNQELFSLVLQRQLFFSMCHHRKEQCPAKCAIVVLLIDLKQPNERIQAEFFQKVHTKTRTIIVGVLDCNEDEQTADADGAVKFVLRRNQDTKIFEDEVNDEVLAEIASAIDSS